MAENNTNIQMRLTSVSEVSFMMSSAMVAHDVAPESIQLGFSSQIQPDADNDKIALIFGTRYELKGDVVLECIYRFEFEIINLAQFITVHGENSLTLTHIMPHFLSVAIGTMRGILVVKTAGTNFSKFPLPMVDPKQLNAKLSNHLE